MRLIFVPLLFLALTLNGARPDDTLYKEPYRQQYHFSPRKGWIGDPSGLLRHNGRYHAYWWGAASSEDLVHWTEDSPFAIKGMPDHIAAFTGSVVVDTANTAGYGHDAYIAAFTSFDKNTTKQSQSIAFSRDGGREFQYYDLNPVVDIWSTEFRDPTVFRHEPTGRWIMVVAKALEKKVAFYGSSDLKHWEWLSEFGPAGDNERSWECPDMFELAVDGDPDNRRWVLVVSVNWAHEQYFTGSFDGVTFTADPVEGANYVDEGLDYYASRTFQDFDSDRPEEVYSLGWVATWDYAHHVPGEHGKGCWSIPRRLGLKSTPGGLRLTQQPAEAFTSLRGKPVTVSRRLNKGVTPMKDVSEMGNVYEIMADFVPGDGDTSGFRLCTGSGKKLVISYDTDAGRLTVDRTNTAVSPIVKFDRIASCQLPLDDGHLKLRIFTDRTSVEIFSADGEKVMTLQTFCDPTHTGAELFSLLGNTSVDLTAWPLSSIWGDRR